MVCPDHVLDMVESTVEEHRIQGEVAVGLRESLEALFEGKLMKIVEIFLRREMAKSPFYLGSEDA